MYHSNFKFVILVFSAFCEKGVVGRGSLATRENDLLVVFEYRLHQEVRILLVEDLDDERRTPDT